MQPWARTRKRDPFPKRHQASNPLWSQTVPAFSFDRVRFPVPCLILTKLTDLATPVDARFADLFTIWGNRRSGRNARSGNCEGGQDFR